MKNKISKRILAGILTFGMAASLMPTTVLAAETVTTTPGNTSLQVEYFSSTLYSWDESAANAATAKVDNNAGKGFYFTASDNTGDNVPAFSTWSNVKDSTNTTIQNYSIYSGLAASKLSESSNAPFSDSVNAANLFATDGSNSDYANVYTNVSVPYVYDEDTGYYTLDSDSNAVYFENGNGNSNTQMLIADKPAYYVGYSGTSAAVTGFAPFNGLTSRTGYAYKSGSTSDNTNRTQAYLISRASNANYDANGMKYGFGMVTTVNFQMTDNGKDADGNDITFEFSGDDDVWVYIDGVLALDIGGTHDAITGTINFATGEVTLHSADGYDTIGDLATGESASNSDGLSQTNLYEALNTTLTGFASEGSHTLTIYYMDRGQGRTNCLIRFNLPQKDTVSVTKEITQSKDEDGTTSPLTESEQASIDNVNFGFTIYEGTTALADKTYYIYDADNNLTGTATTNSSGHFTLKNGQTARFNVDIGEDGESYYVVEDSLADAGYTEPEYTWSSSISGAEVTSQADGYTSMTVQASGSDTAADTISFVCENFLDANLPNPGVAPMDDMYVIDYGLPVEIESVISNDVWRGEKIELTSVEEVGDYVEESGAYGEVNFDSDGTVRYTLTKQLDQVVTLQYTVKVTGTGNVGTEEVTETAEDTATIYIIPATSMYYEENFSDMITYSDENVKWEEITDNEIYGEYQEEGEVGDPDDSIYGTDSIYLNNLGDSYGTSMYACTDGIYAAKFKYDFTGTGTAIYSRISEDSAYIQVKITNDSGTTEDLQYIDTRIIGDVAASTELYNIPVYNNSGLDYGTYHVTVTVYKEGTPVNGWYDKDDGNFVEGSDESGSDFYLDGIRVYQPLVDDDIAESAYASDGESNIALINIRSKMVADEEVIGTENFVTLTDVDEAIISVDDYSSIGPNEELYLNDGAYTVSFYLVNWDSQLYNLYLGMKAPAGSAATVEVGGYEITLNNSADCYYNVSDYVTVEQVDTDDDGVADLTLGTLTISGVNGLASLTNIKVTGVDEFDIGYSEDYEAGDIDTNTLYLMPSNYSFTDDSEEETEVFVPESLKAVVNYVKLTKKATVTVASSTDVAYVTIDGTKVEPQKAGSSYTFSLSFTKVAKGESFDVIAYNEDGVASETYTVTVE